MCLHRRYFTLMENRRFIQVILRRRQVVMLVYWIHLNLPVRSLFSSILISKCSPVDTSILSRPERSTLRWSQTLDAVRQWSTRTFKFTRQLFQESLGQGLQTHDIELEQSIEVRFSSVIPFSSKIEHCRFSEKPNVITNVC